jgi:hypothetical protein
VKRSGLPPNTRTLGTRWVFAIKENGEYKARLVCQGFRQIHGVDYFETASPCGDLATVKMVIAWTLVNNRYLVRMDISAAFLNGKMDVDLYLRLPKGTHSPFGEDGLWKAISSIYGTKQAPYLWSETLREELLKKGYTQCKGDPCLWYLEEDGISILVCIWVDDFAVSVPNLASEERFSKDISCFEHKVFGKVNCLLGVHYSWDPIYRRVFMSQQPHVEDMLKRYDQEEGPDVDLPCPAE